jgi:hypothetical protein
MSLTEKDFNNSSLGQERLAGLLPSNDRGDV